MPGRKRFRIVPIVLALVVGILIGAFAMPQKEAAGIAQGPAGTTVPGMYSVDISVPAVDDEGHGIATQLTVETKPGTGRVLTNIDKLLFWTDTQQSIQTARAVAENISAANTSKLDIIYSIRTDNATIVGGPSAGAALTLATIAALERRQLNSSVMITGTINDDGTIGPVGGVLEKAKAAKSVGAKLFLVPIGEGTDIVIKPIEKCFQRPDFTYCETTYSKTSVSIGENADIEVREIADIGEAVKYLLV